MEIHFQLKFHSPHVLFNEVINDIPNAIEYVLSMFALNLQFVMHIKVAPRIHIFVVFICLKFFCSGFKLQSAVEIENAGNVDPKNKRRV